LRPLDRTGAHPHDDFLRHNERAVFVIPKEEVKGKRYPRFIHLHGPALEIVRRIVQRRKQGKRFRNTRGEPWTN
jgi:hypothetical protein